MCGRKEFQKLFMLILCTRVFYISKNKNNVLDVGIPQVQCNSWFMDTYIFNCYDDRIASQKNTIRSATDLKSHPAFRTWK